MTQPRERLVSGLQLAILIAAIALGCALRIWYYLKGFSFFLDECALALNVVHRSYATLAQGLDFDQAAPLGFLYLLKLETGTLGSSEAVFRLVPLLSSIGAIFAFYMLTRTLSSGWALVAANVLMCVNQMAISYSAQGKQYSLEMLGGVLMLWFSGPLFRSDSSWKVFWFRTVALALIPWFSFSAVFVLSGIGAALAFSGVIGAGVHLRRAAGAIFLWMVLWIPVYILSIRPGMANRMLAAFWAAQYFPLHAPSQVPRWIFNRLLEFGILSFHKRLWVLAAAGLFAGVVASLRRRDMLLLSGCATILACFGAAVLQKYPFGGRLILFLVPIFILLMVQGFQELRAVVPAWGGLVLQIVALVALLWCTESAIKAYAFHPGFPDEPREALRFARANWKTGDHLYVSGYSSPCVLYYNSSLRFPTSQIELNVSAVDGAEHTPTALSVPVTGGRDWLIEMRTDWEKRGQSVPVREYFETNGRLVARKDMEWTSALLFEVR